MDDPPALDDLLFKWFNNRKYKINRWSVFMIEATHYKMRGALAGLITSHHLSLLYEPFSLMRLDKYKAPKFGEVFGCDIHQADFFPKLDAWLKAMRKKYPVRKSKKKRIS